MLALILTAVFSLFALLAVRRFLLEIGVPALVCAVLLGLVLPLWMYAFSSDWLATTWADVWHLRWQSVLVDLVAASALALVFAVGIWRTVGTSALLVALGFVVSHGTRSLGLLPKPLTDVDTWRSQSARALDRNVRALLRSLGWTAVRSHGGANDRRVLTAIDVDGRRTLVHCWAQAPSGRLASPAIQQALDHADAARVARALVVTPHEFTRTARRLAAQRSDQCALWDGSVLAGLAGHERVDDLAIASAFEE